MSLYKNLSLRLKALYDLALVQDRVVYDLCCDHGQLGLAIHVDKKPKQTILNDKVHSITDKLKDLVQEQFPDDKTIIVKNEDASKIELLHGDKKLIFIAGVGGPLIIEIIDNIFDNLNEEDILVISPHTKVHEVRKHLHNKGFNLIDEVLIEEQEQFYEHIVITKGKTSRAISPIGELFWTRDLEKSLRYQQKWLTYYGIKVDKNTTDEIKLLFSFFKAMKFQE